MTITSMYEIFLKYVLVMHWAVWLNMTVNSFRGRRRKVYPVYGVPPSKVAVIRIRIPAVFAGDETTYPGAVGLFESMP